jgi:hypothetical protein
METKNIKRVIKFARYSVHTSAERANDELVKLTKALRLAKRLMKLNIGDTISDDERKLFASIWLKNFK